LAVGSRVVVVVEVEVVVEVVEVVVVHVEPETEHIIVMIPEVGSTSTRTLPLDAPLVHTQSIEIRQRREALASIALRTLNSL
jgi:hypothetical protein